MSGPLSNLTQLIRSMEPQRHHGVFVFASVPHRTEVGPLAPLATFREAEGLTVILPEATARQNNLTVLFRAAWITLTVPSDLHAVGLTAAFSGALAEAGISCNVVAGAFHDHLFVPVESATLALDVLLALQRNPDRHP